MPDDERLQANPLAIPGAALPSATWLFDLWDSRGVAGVCSLAWCYMYTVFMKIREFDREQITTPQTSEKFHSDIRSDERGGDR